MTSEAPPPYTTTSPEGLPPFAEHSVTNADSKSGRILTLSINTRTGSGTHFIVEGDSINGTVSLDLSKASSFKSVSVSFVGTMTVVGNVRYTFGKVTHECLPQVEGKASRFLHFAGQNHQELAEGHHAWPFTIDLPHTIKLKNAIDGSDTYPLPPTFRAHLGKVLIAYEVTASITQGLLSEVRSTSTPVHYIPALKPSPPSRALQLAYEKNSSLPGPSEDPNGWHTLPKVEVRGLLFDGSEVSATYQLSLALPLSYTRGSTIPLWLVLESANTQALDLLSAPKASVVRLIRIVKDRFSWTPLEIGAVLDLTTADITENKQPTQDMQNDIQTAVWWVDATKQEDRVRVLQGEIHLNPRLQPSAHLGYFKNSYAVELYLPQCVGFAGNGEPDTALQRVPIELGTIYAEGPRPISHTPPHYDTLPEQRGDRLTFATVALTTRE